MSRGILIMLLLAALSFPACSGEKDSRAEQSSADEAAVPVEAGVSAAADVAETGEDSAPVSVTEFQQSVMDVVCAASGIIADKDGSLLITDTYNKVVWRVQPHNGVSVVYAGRETVADLYGEPVGGYNDSSREGSYFRCPWAIAPFLDGWAVSDTDNNAVRLISKDKVQTINGITTEKLTVRNLGVVFDHPTGLTVDEEGSLYVSDTNNGAVRKITKNGKVSTVADKLKGPTGLCWKDGTLYIAETDANRIVRIRDNALETVAGSGENGYLDGETHEAVFAFPKGLTVGDDGTIYVADTGNSAIRVVKDGQVSTLLARDRASMELCPVSPVGLLLAGEDLYICDNFARKVLRVSVEFRAAGNKDNARMEQESIDSAEASVVQLAKTEGDVAVTGAAGKGATIIKNMRLSSGYHVTSQKKSYAWLELDKAKLVKEDALSDLEIRKKGKVLEVLLQSGNMFFNVTEPLKSDETLNICTSTMVAGIRGTCGWTKIIDRTCTRVYLLEGRLECVVTDPVTGQSEETVLNAGEWADFYVYDESRDGERCDIVYEKFEKEDVPGFVLVELAGDTERCQEIYEDSGIDLRDLTMEEALESRKKDEDEQEEALRKLEELIAEMENNVDQDPVWEEETEMPKPAPEPKPAPDPDPTPEVNDGEGSSEEGGDAEDGGGEDTRTESFYRVDADMSVPAGTTLTVKKNETLLVESGSVVTVDGTLLVEGNAENNGTIIVNSGESVHVTGSFENKGSIINQNSGLFEAAGGIDNYGSITCDGNSTMISDSGKGTVRMRSDRAKLILSGGNITNTGSGAALELESAEQLENVTLTAKTLLRSVIKDVLTADGKPLEVAHFYIAYDGSAYYEFKIERKTVSLNSNTGAGSTVTEVQVIYGDKVGKGMPAPERTGYTLTGWNTAEDGSGTAFTRDTVVTEDRKVYAQWTANVYKVTLNAGGGTIGEGKTVTGYTYGIGATLPTAADMTKERHVFVGWYEDATFSGEAVTGISGTDLGDKVYYARWAVSAYRVTLHSNSGVIADGRDVTAYTYGIGATLPTAADMTREGHVFVGWYEDAAFSGEAVTGINGTDTGDREFYALWDALAGAFTVRGGAMGTDFAYDRTDASLHIMSETPLTVRNTAAGTTGEFITIDEGVNADLTLAGVRIDTAERAALMVKCAEGTPYETAVRLQEGSENILCGGMYGIFCDNRNNPNTSGVLAVSGASEGEHYDRLKLEGSGSGIYAHTVNLTRVDLDVSGDTSHCIYAAGFTIKDSTVKAVNTGNGGGVYCTGSLEVKNSALEAASNGQNGIWVQNTLKATGGEIKATSSKAGNYDIGTNSGSVYGGIYVEGAIELTDCTVTATGADCGLYGESTIDITGCNVTATGSETAADSLRAGICGRSNITLKNGVVNAAGAQNGIYSRADLKVTGCELTAEGKNENGIFVEAKADIANSTLAAVGGDDYNGIYSYGSVDVLGSDITASGITVYGGEYFKVGQYGDTKSSLSVTGSGIRATSGTVQIANCINVNVVSSGVSGNHGIYGVESVIISDCAEVTATSTAGLSYGIWCQGGIAIENCGNVTAAGVNSGIESNETVNITNSKVSAAGENNYGIYGVESLTISNSEVNAESEGIYAAVAAPEISIQNSTVNARGSTGIDDCGGSLTATDTVVFDGASGLVYGNATLGSSLYAAALNIPAGTSLTVPAGASLTVPAGKTLTVLENASMTIESGASLNISDGGTVIIKNGAVFNGVENVVKETGGTLTDER